MILRNYQSSDCEEVVRLFYNTVHTVNRNDYRDKQLNVWAPVDYDAENLNHSLLNSNTLVAVIKAKIVGFGNIDNAGLLDRLYVDKDFQGVGIATKLCDRLETIAKTEKIRTYVSITAVPFFKNRGYRVARENVVTRQGIELKNLLMVKYLSHESIN